MSPLKHAEKCLRCGGQNWMAWKHWMVCLTCEPEYELKNAPAKPDLLDKGIPRPNRAP